MNVNQSGFYDINLNIAAPSSGGKILIYLDGQILVPVQDVPTTGGWQNWKYITAKNVFISSGSHVLQASFFFGGYNFSYIDFVLVTTDIRENSETPLSFNLQQNYPNPFNPTTRIEYSIPYAAEVIIAISDIMGKEVEVLVNEFKNPGNYSIQFDASELSSGVYFYQMKAGNYLSNKKLILLK